MSTRFSARRARSTGAVLGALAMGAATMTLAPMFAAEAPSGLQAILEFHNTYFAIGEPIEMRFSIWNPGEGEVRALPEAPLTKHFEVTDADGQQLPLSPGVTIDAPRPESLPPGGHYGIAFDLSRLFPRLKLGGTYRVVWKSPPLSSNQVVLKVVPPYDPKRQYRATIETTMGNILLEFFPDKAPLAVKNFIELAQSGFYDGTRFHYVDPGRMISGGDRGGLGTGTPGYTIPMEQNDLQMLAGTVAMKKAGAPPTNGSQFFILVTPRQEFTGQYTVFAQVVDGLGVVRKISEVPSTGRRGNPSNVPLTDMIIRKVAISEKPSAK